jgi:MFS family permease
MSKVNVPHSVASLDSPGLSSERPSDEQLSHTLQWQADFEPGDDDDPKVRSRSPIDESALLIIQTWGTLFRIYLTGIAGITVLNASFASSAPVGILKVMSTELQMSSLVGVMTISLFVAGFAVGPFVWAPLSESYGRRPIFMIAFALCTGCQIGCALSRTSAQMLVFRFLGGCFSAAPLTNSGGLISDIWDVDHRGQAMSVSEFARKHPKEKVVYLSSML